MNLFAATEEDGRSSKIAPHEVAGTGRSREPGSRRGSVGKERFRLGVTVETDEELGEFRYDFSSVRMLSFGSNSKKERLRSVGVAEIAMNDRLLMRVLCAGPGSYEQLEALPELQSMASAIAVDRTCEWVDQGVTFRPFRREQNPDRAETSSFTPSSELARQSEPAHRAPAVNGADRGRSGGWIAMISG